MKMEEIIIKTNGLDELVGLILDKKKMKEAYATCFEGDCKIKSFSIVNGNVKMHPSIMAGPEYIMDLSFHTPFEINLNSSDIDCIVEKYGLKYDMHTLQPKIYQFDIFTAKKKNVMGFIPISTKDKDIIQLGKNKIHLDFRYKETKQVTKDILNYYLTKGKIK